MRLDKVEQLNVAVFDTSFEMGKQVAIDFANEVKSLLEQQDEVRCVFAAAPSQNPFIAYLIENCDVDWTKVVAFHMDEYIGLAPNSESSFSYFLHEKLFSKVPISAFHVMDTSTMSTSDLSDQYSKMLSEKEIDIVVMGIGENGHIAFNDPPVADFNDPLKVKVVELDEACKIQQVNDGAFETINDVPTHAVTMTVPALIDTKKIFCIVPGVRKAEAVHNTLTGPIKETCPASILRTCSYATLYVDSDAFSQCDASLLEL
ncbi:6-phosphogluconolactonase [Portibacter lacus]|uniref:Glucosamine-6-phosphate deaminase n=1 Tax=Portibacter lacus TaxID=1099794 RepID=A0AA37ST04_9BACT|nr:6-phosphogluconolactonase [Portibacter lacus]GLR19823.1 glucosamine-6-phosphate deaminase [Portibacter lacus]